MHTFLRILAVSFLTAAILWGCTPLATSLTSSRIQSTNSFVQTLIAPTKTNVPALNVTESNTPAISVPANNLTANNLTATPPTEVNLTEVTEYSPEIPNQARTGICSARSQRVSRTNVWQCTVDDTTYDPCFTVGAEEIIVCTENFLDPASDFRVDLMAPLPATPSTSSLNALNLEDLKSLWYFGIDAVDGAVVLTDGEFHFSAPANRSIASSDATVNNTSPGNDIVVRLSELKTEGDLDLDGDMDAASVLIATSSDIFTRYYLVAIMNENGKAVNSATISLGDGIRVDNLAIENGQIVVDMTTHGLQDPLCCPSLTTTHFYNLNHNQLDLYTGAWQVELNDGVRCSLPTTLSNTFGYRCTDGRSLVNSLQPGTIWTAQRPRIDASTIPAAIDVETVAIRRLWQ